MSESHPLDAEAELFIARKDRVMSAEAVMIDGLHQAVEKGWMSEQEMQEYLAEYLEKRDAPNS
jgi:hypothetical protein